MDRGATLDVIAEIEASKNQPIHLIEVEFSTTTYYLTDAWRDISWDNGGGAHTYTALGHFISFSDIEESATAQVSSLTAQLSGIDQTLIYSVLAEYYIDRPIRIYKGFVGPAFYAQNITTEVVWQITTEAEDHLITEGSSEYDSKIVPNPILIFEGRIDSPVIQENPDDGTCSLSVAATNAWVDFERLSGRHTNHEEQQLFYPGDKGFEFVSELNQEILWGRV